VLVAIVNHPSQAPVARPVLDALIDWTFKDVSPNTTVISATLTPTTLTASHD
jgi:hypothetical protein